MQITKVFVTVSLVTPHLMNDHFRCVVVEPLAGAKNWSAEYRLSDMSVSGVSPVRWCTKRNNIFILIIN